MDWRARRWMVTTCMCYCCHCRSFVDNNSLSSARMKSTSLVCLSRSFIRYFMSTSKSIRYLLHISLIIQAIWREKKERERKRRTTTRYLHQKLKIWFISHAHTHTYALHSCIKTCWNDMVFTNFRTATYRNWTFLLFTSGDQLVSQHFFCTAILVDCHFWWHVVLFFLSLSLIIATVECGWGCGYCSATDRHCHLLVMRVNITLHCCCCCRCCTDQHYR